MSIWKIALKNLQQRWLSTSLTSLSVALGTALVVAVILINGAVSQVFTRVGSSYDLVVGAKGSDTQLVLSSVYYMDRPIENLPWRYYQELKNRPTVKEAIPVNLGDRTEVGNFPIIGTTPQYFLVGYSHNQEFRVRGDFLRGTWDAVIGSQVAKKNNWDIGSEFRMIHAGEDDHVHDEVFTVKGVLQPTGTPNDRGVFVHIDGFFALAGHDKPINEAIQREAKFYGETEESLRIKYAADIAHAASHDHSHDHSGDDHGHHHETIDLQKEVTSILLVMKGEGARGQLVRSNSAMALQTELRKGYQAQGANVVIVMERLLQNLVGNIRDAMLALAILIVIVSGIGIFVSMYNTMSERKREIAIMRALGARRTTVFSIIVIEALLMCLIGGLLGIGLGHLMVMIAAPIIESRSGLLIDPLRFDLYELYIIPALMLMAVIAAQIPGMTAYRTDVAEALQA